MTSSPATRHPPASSAGEVDAADGGAAAASRPGGAGARTTPNLAQRSRLIPLVVRFAAGTCILAAALAIAWLLVANRKQALRAPVEEVVRRVRAIEIEPRPAESVVRVWEGFGTARARDFADVAAEVSGRVVGRPAHIDPGTAVRAGEVLVRLDDADYRELMQAATSATRALMAQAEGLDVEQVRLEEQVEQVREQVELTRWELERLESARAGAAASDLELVRLRAALLRLDGERARLQQQLDMIPSRRAATLAEADARRNDAAVAERQRDRTVITSPIDGVLQSIDANIGERMQPGQRVARVVGLNRIEIPLQIAASAQGEVRIGAPATVRAGGDRGPSWPAHVARVAPEADPRTRMITVFLEVEQAAPAAGEAPLSSGFTKLLLPGKFVTARLEGVAANGATLMIVPRRAVADDRVWVAVRDDADTLRAQPRQVSVLHHVEARIPDLDEDETQWAVIGAGLRAGDRVIVTNLDELIPGVRVHVVGDRSESSTSQQAPSPRE